MAFAINVTLADMEFRGLQSGTSSRTGKPWMSLIFEDADTNQLSCSVPVDMQGDVYSLGLRKGDKCVISFRAVARADGESYVMLRAVPEIQDDTFGDDE